MPRVRHRDQPHGEGLLLGLTQLGDEAREAIGQLHSGTGNDNGQAIAFFAFWLLMIGYAGKAVWDEARDRVAALFEHEIVKATVSRVAQSTGVEVNDE